MYAVIYRQHKCQQTNETLPYMPIKSSFIQITLDVELTTLDKSHMAVAPMMHRVIHF